MGVGRGVRDNKNKNQIWLLSLHIAKLVCIYYIQHLACMNFVLLSDNPYGPLLLAHNVSMNITNTVSALLSNQIFCFLFPVSSTDKLNSSRVSAIIHLLKCG